MKIKDNLKIYLVFILVFVVLGIYNYVNKSQWIIDNVLSLSLITIVFFIAPWLKAAKKEFSLICVALLIHNLGSFGFYELTFLVFGYDDFVHFVSAGIVAFMLFNFIVKTMSVKKVYSKSWQNNLNKVFVIIVIVVSIVTMFGLFIELVEFAGFMFLEPGEGILFYGSGDGDNPDEVITQYSDTMKDFFVNFIGALAGSFVFLGVSRKYIVTK